MPKTRESAQPVQLSQLLLLWRLAFKGFSHFDKHFPLGFKCHDIVVALKTCDTKNVFFFTCKPKFLLGAKGFLKFQFVVEAFKSCVQRFVI